MITAEPEKRLKPQACPFCGQEQDIIVNGHEFHPDDKSKILALPDYGYSFCNCRNIFYTDWENMKQEDYDASYENKYTNENVRLLMLNYAKAYFRKIKELTEGKSFLEIGAVVPFLLDEAKRQGFQTTALDIISHKFDGHPTICANFESSKWSALNKENLPFWVFEPEQELDVIWASHIFEHFKDPIAAAEKCFNLLNPSGVLFVAMPDPYAIDWKSPYAWGHWHIREHHILWDMESFCEMMEEVGFKTVMKHKNFGCDFLCIGDYHLIFQKP